MTRLFAGTEWDQPPQCERCGKLEVECRCPPAPEPPKQLTPPDQQTARLAVEKRKRGKVVTVIRGLAAADNDMPALLTQLKTQCGAGGTVRDDQIEIQGDHLGQIRESLAAIGYRVKA